MTTFQFYKKRNAIIHIDINTLSFDNDKQELIKQGFELIGSTVKAETSYAAFNQFKSLYLKKSQQFNNSHIYVNNMQLA